MTIIALRTTQPKAQEASIFTLPIDLHIAICDALPIAFNSFKFEICSDLIDLQLSCKHFYYAISNTPSLDSIVWNTLRFNRFFRGNTDTDNLSLEPIESEETHSHTSSKSMDSECLNSDEGCCIVRSTDSSENECAIYATTSSSSDGT